MSVITWRNVQGPNYRGANALNIAANKNLNNAITSGSEAIQGFGDVIIDQNTGEAITGINAMDNRDEFAGASADYIAGLGPNVDLTRVAEAQTARGLALDEAFSRKLTDKENQLDIDLAQSNLNYLPKERKFAEALHTANMGRIGAATGASQASTARDVYGLDEDKRLGDIKRKDKEVTQKLMTFRQQLGDNVQDADDVDAQVNAYAQELKATPEAIAGFNIAHNNLTQRTDAEAREAESLAADEIAEAKLVKEVADRAHEIKKEYIKAGGGSGGSQNVAQGFSELEGATGSEEDPWFGIDFDEDSKATDKLWSEPYLKSLPKNSDTQKLIRENWKKGAFGGKILDREGFLADYQKIMARKIRKQGK